MIDLPSILKVAVENGASDVHLKAGLPPLFRVAGALVPLRNGPRMTSEVLAGFFKEMAAPPVREELQRNREVDFAFAAPTLGRFRVAAFQQRQTLALALRVVPSEIRSIDALKLPTVVKRIANEQRGLVLVTGATGSGKSTTLAAMIEQINNQRTAHILTIEDPVEFLFRDRRSIVNQREVGLDTRSFARALRSALRQDPDVILVGEMRDRETIETALTAAETGHLVLSTLHTVDAAETISRIVHSFPPHQHQQIRLACAASIRAVISQRLLKRADGRGRVAALEVMLATARVRELIAEEGRLTELREAMAEGHQSYGMQTFDQALMSLLRGGLIDKDEALRNCTNKDDFLLRLAGVSGTSDVQWQGFDQ